MKWEELTSKDVEEVDKENTVVVLPIGSIEVHGSHLPLGTDTMVIYHIALKAAEEEGAVVLPPLYYAYVPENKHFPGTISLNSETFLKLVEDILEEVARHGFRKILILNGHGGNRRPLRLLLRRMLEKGFKAHLYILVETLAPILDVIEEVKETEVYEHACEIETSLVMALRPDLIKLERVKRPAKLGKRWAGGHLETMVDWQRYAPMGYVGDPRRATVEKGKKIIDLWVKRIVEAIKIIKDDAEYERVLREYYERLGEPKLEVGD